MSRLKLNKKQISELLNIISRYLPYVEMFEDQFLWLKDHPEMVFQMLGEIEVNWSAYSRDEFCNNNMWNRMMIGIQYNPVFINPTTTPFNDSAFDPIHTNEVFALGFDDQVRREVILAKVKKDGLYFAGLRESILFVRSNKHLLKDYNLVVPGCELIGVANGHIVFFRMVDEKIVLEICGFASFYEPDNKFLVYPKP